MAAKKQTTSTKSTASSSQKKSSASGSQKKSSASSSQKRKSASSSKSGTGSSSVKKNTASSQKRSTSAGRKSTPKQTAEKSAAASAGREYIDYGLVHEVLLWVVLAFCILLFIGLLGMGGALGRSLSRMCFGLFGTMAYIFPFFLFFISAFLVSNTGRRSAKWKAFGAFLLFVVLCAFFHQILVGYSQGATFSDAYEGGAQYHMGGGGVGGWVMGLLYPVLGLVGSYVSLVILMLICIILITRRSLFKPVRSGGRSAASKVRGVMRSHHEWAEDQRKAREEEEERKRLLEEERMERERLEDKNSLPVNITILPREDGGSRRSRKVSGVRFDNRLSAQGTSSPRTGSGEVRQIYPGVTETTLAPVGRMQTDDDMPDFSDSSRREPAAMNTLRSTFSVMNDEKAAPKAAKPVSARTPAVREPGVSGLETIVSVPEVPEEIQPSAADSASAYSLPEEAEEAVAVPEETVRKERAPRKEKASAQEIQEGIDSVRQEIDQSKEEEKNAYVFPPLDLMKYSAKKGTMTRAELQETADKLAQVFQTFGVNVHITNVTHGPSVTRYELTPEMGVKVSKITGLQDDIMLNLAASDIRIEAPIPGKAAVGIEVPNKVAAGVSLREMLETPEFQNHPSPIAYAVGRDIAGKVIVSDIAKMPHLLIAGATGSGKSVFINTLIMSILYKSSPEDVKLIMIDPKVVELSVYNGIPHLYIPVVTDPRKAAGALNWAVAEMSSRYEKFAKAGVREIKGYNRRVEEAAAAVTEGEKPEKMPQIVIIVDELADLMMVSSSEVEEAICRLAQLARAAGIHLVIATQRPSVDVITGLIKANMPSRIAFAVSSGVDSRTILDMTGAEKLLGNGDMLFAPSNYKQPVRVQGAFISDGEVAAIVDFLKNNNGREDYSKQMEQQMETVAKAAAAASGGADVDELFTDAGKFIIEKDKASIGMLQRWFKIGFNRAARIMDQLSDAGVVGPEEGTKPRKVLMSMEQFENYLEEN